VRCLLAHFTTHQDRVTDLQSFSHPQDCINALTEEFTDALAGDFNSLDNDDVVSYCAMSAIVNQPTRGDNVLDRIYVSGLDYESVQVVTSLVKSDHRAAIAYTRLQKHDVNKRTERRTFRKRTPAQHASFLQYASQLKIEFPDDNDVQKAFDYMYDVMASLPDRFYPGRGITTTSKDPRFVTPTIKALLRRKNRLMRAGRTEEADAVSSRVRDAITRQNKAWLRRVNTRQDARDA